MSGARLLGLDLAWKPNNRTGAAVLDADGRLLDACADLRGDDEILAWVRRWLGASGVIGIDMPTIVPNDAGSRRCERELAAVFRKHHAGPYPAHRNLDPFRDGGRAARIIDALRPDGVVEDVTIAPRDARNVAIEVFPHAAMVRLFGLDRIYPYKKKQRPWATVLAAWSRYRASLATLAAADPPLLLDETLVPSEASARRYKQFDDLLDGIICAYVASFVHRWGSSLPNVRVFGDLDEGYIVVPERCVWPLERPGNTAP